MNSGVSSVSSFPLAVRVLLLGLAGAAGAAHAPAARVTVERHGDRFVLQRDGQAVHLQGAVAPNRFDLLAACGANAVRTNANRATLDAAHQAGLLVLANLPVRGERDGIDWDNDQQFAEQKARVLAVVREVKDHPAVAVWSLGNELDWIPPGRPYHPRLWQRLNDLAQAVKAIDPDHPILTVLGTSTYQEKLQELVRDGPAFDLLGINAYGDLAEVTEITRQYWPKPYLVTEWGPTGHWEVKKTAWGAPLEQSSSEKAQVIAERYRNVILADPRHCLGSFVFYWSEKQETTHTWYGMFHQGLRTESIDVMQHFWSGRWPENRAPQIDGLAIEGHADPRTIVLQPGEEVRARVQAQDLDGDALIYAWEIRPEVEIPQNSYAGQGERPAEPLPGLVREPGKATTRFRAPTAPGAYRVFVTLTDGRGSTAYGNLPFQVP